MRTPARTGVIIPGDVQLTTSLCFGGPAGGVGGHSAARADGAKLEKGGTVAILTPNVHTPKGIQELFAPLVTEAATPGQRLVGELLPRWPSHRFLG